MEREQAIEVLRGMRHIAACLAASKKNDYERRIGADREAALTYALEAIARLEGLEK